MRRVCVAESILLFHSSLTICSFRCCDDTVFTKHTTSDRAMSYFEHGWASSRISGTIRWSFIALCGRSQPDLQSIQEQQHTVTIAEHQHSCVCLCVCLHTHLYIYMYTYIGRTSDIYTHARTHRKTEKHIYIYIYMCVYIYMYMHVHGLT